MLPRATRGILAGDADQQRQRVLEAADGDAAERERCCCLGVVGAGLERGENGVARGGMRREVDAAPNLADHKQHEASSASFLRSEAIM